MTLINGEYINFDQFCYEKKGQDCFHNLIIVQKQIAMFQFKPTEQRLMVNTKTNNLIANIKHVNLNSKQRVIKAIIKKKIKKA